MVTVQARSAESSSRTHSIWESLFDVDRAWLAVSLLLAECGFLFFYGLSAGELYRTETLRAIVAAEFLRSGNWVVPSLYGEPFFTKPPGMYAAIALASLPTGQVTEFSARVPSALAGTLTVLMFFWYFRRHFGNHGALIAALLLPLSFMWLDKATAAEIDMMQTAWVSAAIIFFLRAVEAEEEARGVRGQESGVSQERIEGLGRMEEGNPLTISPPSPLVSRPSPLIPGPWPLAPGPWGWWFAALLCVAGGVLTKWTAPAFFYAMATPFLWRSGRLRLLCGAGHVLALVLAALVCIVWICLAVRQTDWQTWHDTVSREALIRLLPSHHPKPYPWRESLMHPVKILAINIPWSLLALYALNPRFKNIWNSNQRRVLLGMHCWTWPNLLFWSLIPEHAFRHAFPLFPGISGLAALVCVAWSRSELPALSFARLPDVVKWRVRPITALVGVMAIWILIKLAYVHVVIPRRNETRQPREKGALVASLVPEGETLYLFALKDEGLMFYYRRPVLRLTGPDKLLSSALPAYCILDEKEWQDWSRPEPTTVVGRLRDAQNDPVFLVRIDPRSPLGL